MSRQLRKLLRNRLTIPLTPFYQSYPYRGGLAIDSADARGSIDLEMGFFYNRIPKAANSTIITTLARMRFQQEIPSRSAKKLFLTPSLLRSREVENFSNLFCFTFVRNPFTRTLSAYLDKIERRAHRRNRPSTFINFLYELKEGKLHSNAHWAPQSDLFLIPIDHFSFIGKVETLQADLSRVKNQLQQKDPDEQVKSVLSNATNANSKLSSYYDEEAIQLVRTLYQQDFELLDYSKNLPK